MIGFYVSVFTPHINSVQEYYQMTGILGESKNLSHKRPLFERFGE